MAGPLGRNRWAAAGERSKFRYSCTGSALNYANDGMMEIRPCFLPKKHPRARGSGMRPALDLEGDVTFAGLFRAMGRQMGHGQVVDGGTSGLGWPAVFDFLLTGLKKAPG